MSNKFVVSPMSQRIELKPGETFKGSIIVANPADATEDFAFKVSVSPYSVTGENYAPDFETMSAWTEIVNWVTLDTTSGKLAPNEKMEVNFKIEVPLNVAAGGQFAKIGITSDDHTQSEGVGVVQNVFEMASLLYLNIDGDVRHEGEILNNTIPGFVTAGKPTTTISATNTGNVYEVLTTGVSVKDIFSGHVIVPAEDDEKTVDFTIMPETTRAVSRELNRLPTLGIFEVKQEVSYLGETSEVSSIMIVCPFWFIILVVATFISIVSMIAYGRHLKRKRANKTPEVEK